MKVRDYMATAIISANLRDGLRQTFYRMRERDIRHMPVLGDQGELVGIISDRDLRRPDWVDSEPNVGSYYLLDNTVRVEEAMTREPRTVRADAELSVPLTIFLERRYGALPVVDANGKLVGMLSQIDLLRAFADHLSGSSPGA